MFEAETARVFQSPVPFTRRAFGIKPATKANLVAEVFVKSKQAEYLLAQVQGGRRSQKRFERKFASEAAGSAQYWVPGAGSKLNAAGNMTLAQIRKIAARLRTANKDVFIGKPLPAAPFGIWERMPTNKRDAHRIRPLLVQVAAPTYRPRLDMDRFTRQHAPRIFHAEFEKAWKRYVL